LALSPLFCGCGTVFSRSSPDLFGAYPLLAVEFDLVLISEVSGDGGEAMGMAAGPAFFFVTGLVSLPFDLAIDVVALPIDLVAWALGYQRDARLVDARR